MENLELEKAVTPNEIIISSAEAEEFRAFKKQKRIEEAKTAMARVEAECATRGLTLTELKKVCDGAKRTRLSAVRVYPALLTSVKAFLQGSGVKSDCVVGGLGETTTKVKVYECKQARKLGAGEITLVLSPSMLKSGRTGEVRREIKKVVKAAKKSIVKVVAEGEWQESELVKLGRTVAWARAKFLSVQYYGGAEMLKKQLGDSCMLEVTGVNDFSDFKALIKAGVERIATKTYEEFFAMLMKEAELAAL